MKKVMVLTVLALFICSMTAQAWPGQEYVFCGTGCNGTTAYNNALRIAETRMKTLGYSNMEILKKALFVFPNSVTCQLKVRGIK